MVMRYTWFQEVVHLRILELFKLNKWELFTVLMVKIKNNGFSSIYTKEHNN